MDAESIELHCKGYPELWRGGRLLPLKLRRGWALLVYLCESARKVSRSQVALTLWPDAEAALGRGRLRRLCHEVNAALGVDVIVGDVDTLWLDDTAGRLHSDVVEVRRCAMQWLASPGGPPSRAWLDALCARDATHILQGFSLEAEPFNDWLDGRRADQERLIVRALRRGAEHLLGDHRPELAAEAAAVLIRLDPLADAGHVLLLEARGRLGDAGGVEAAYFACAELLRNELGIRPSAAVEASYARASQPRAPITGQAPVTPGALAPLRFADAADGAVAFLEIGAPEAPCGTLVILFGLWSNVEISWENAGIRATLWRLTRRFRVVLVDRRGVGLSERLEQRHSVNTGVEDLEAVRLALGVEKIWLLGNSVGGTIAIEYAAARAARVTGLMLYGVAARSTWAPDHPWGPKDAQLEVWLRQMQAAWGDAISLEQFAPSMAQDQATRDWWARMLRQSASRNSAPAMLRAWARMDVRARLPRITVPTLVVQRTGDRIVRKDAARHLAQNIEGAQFELLQGDDHLMWVGDTDAVLDCIERFVDAHVER